MSTIVVPSEKPIQTEHILVLVHPMRLLVMRSQITDGIQDMVLTVCMMRLIWTMNKDERVVDHLKAIGTGRTGPMILTKMPLRAREARKELATLIAVVGESTPMMTRPSRSQSKRRNS
jgi:hypothetical protein